MGASRVLQGRRVCPGPGHVARPARRCAPAAPCAALGDAEWLAGQAAAAATILGAYAVLTRAGASEDEHRRNACARCGGTGVGPCSCLRWSDDGEGCASCNYTGVTTCPACRGGGTKVPVLVTVKKDAPQDAGLGGQGGPSLARAARPLLCAAAPPPPPLAVVAPPRTRKSSPASPEDRSGRRGGGRGGEADGGGDGGGGGGGRGGKSESFFANAGHAIRTLRSDYASMLAPDDPEIDYSIFRDDVVCSVELSLAPPMMQPVQGVDAYRRAVQAMRSLAHALFSTCELQVLRIWNPTDKSISIRWRVVGALRVVGSLGHQFVFDGVSDYKLDSDGHIYHHRLHNTADTGHQALRERIASLVPAGEPSSAIGSF